MRRCLASLKLSWHLGAIQEPSEADEDDKKSPERMMHAC